MTVMPRRRSRQTALLREVYITDRNNVARQPITAGVVDVSPDWDIDRAGSKGRVDITTHRDVLKPGMWIAPYQVIVPEIGDAIEQQQGHFRLGRPGVTYDGTVNEFGDPVEYQDAFGFDIVDDLASASLHESFYTPINGDVMQDVRVLIKMATAGILGGNLLTNGSFENDGVGWSGPFYEFGASGLVTYIDPDIAAPDGKKIYRPQLLAASPVGSDMYITQDVPLPNGAQFMYLSAIARSASTGRVSMRLNFRDVTNTTISSVDRSWQGVVDTAYARQIMVEPVPIGTAYVRVYLFSHQRVAGQSGTFRWDDIRLGTATGLPLPDDRINLPPSSAVASTRIQTAVGGSYAYDAINAHRLAAIGHHAIYTQQDGVLTTSPLRNLDTATPSRTYREGDYRFIGRMEIPAEDGNVPNHFIAVKESFDGKVPTIYANAYNRNPNDPFSTVSTGRVISADPIMVQDAVSQAALQAVADAARDRQSAQEELVFAVAPDPTLTAYDVIEIVDPTRPRINGKWMIQYLRPGMRPDDPAVEVGARRAITGQEAA